MVKLKELLTGIRVLECTADLEKEIDFVYYDSRRVTENSLFVAISGFASDGNRFIPMAMEKGAAVVVTAKKPDRDIPYVLVESDRLALAYLGRNFFGDPASSMQMMFSSREGERYLESSVFIFFFFGKFHYLAFGKLLFEREIFFHADKSCAGSPVRI